MNKQISRTPEKELNLIKSSKEQESTEEYLYRIGAFNVSQNEDEEYFMGKPVNKYIRKIIY